jgi:HSP20 family protein
MSLLSGSGRTTGSESQPPARPQRVPVNVYRTDEALVLVAPMPGVTENDIVIEVSGMDVTIRARLRSDAPKDYVLHEWEYGSYERTVTLPEAVAEPMAVSLGNGQLAVSLPRLQSQIGTD